MSLRFEQILMCLLQFFLLPIYFVFKIFDYQLSVHLFCHGHVHHLFTMRQLGLQYKKLRQQHCRWQPMVLCITGHHLFGMFDYGIDCNRCGSLDAPCHPYFLVEYWGDPYFIDWLYCLSSEDTFQLL